MDPVSVRSDLRAARKLLRNALRSRRTRHEVARRQADATRPAAGTIQIAVYFADTRVNLYQIRQWYAPLAELAKTAPGDDPHPQPGCDPHAAGRVAGARRLLRRVTDLEHFVDEQDLRDRVLRQPEHQELPDVPVRPHVARVHQPRRVRQDVHDHEPVQGVRLRARRGSGGARPARPQALGLRLRQAGPSRSGARRPTTSPARCRTPPDDRTVVLYAPTWEGDRPTAGVRLDRLARRRARGGRARRRRRTG